MLNVYSGSINWRDASKAIVDFNSRRKSSSFFSNFLDEMTPSKSKKISPIDTQHPSSPSAITIRSPRMSSQDTPRRNSTGRNRSLMQIKVSPVESLYLPLKDSLTAMVLLALKLRGYHFKKVNKKFEFLRELRYQFTEKKFNFQLYNDIKPFISFRQKSADPKARSNSLEVSELKRRARYLEDDSTEAFQRRSGRISTITRSKLVLELE